MRYPILILLTCCGLLCAQIVPVHGDATFDKRDTSAAVDSTQSRADSAGKAKPITPALLSLIVPGGGQFSTGHYVKGSVILAGSAILGAVTYATYQDYRIKRDDASVWNDSLNVNRNVVTIQADTITTTSGDSIAYDTSFVGVHYDMEYQYAKFLKTKASYSTYQGLLWCAGFYYYNVLDALKSTGHFTDSLERNPTKAALLSAIPFAGLGQLYNGELGKAGIIFMTQTSLAFMAYTNHLQMRICEKNIEKIENSGNVESKDADASRLDKLWNSARNDAFKSRNTYIWYSLALYLYGIVDAVVDAHLHDLPSKMQIEPDIVPQHGKVGMQLKYNF